MEAAAELLYSRQGRHDKAADPSQVTGVSPVIRQYKEAETTVEKGIVLDRIPNSQVATSAN